MCGYREIKNIDKKYHNDIVWFIWEIIIKESKKKSDFVIKNIESLFKMYKYDYGPSKKKKRSYFFLFAIIVTFLNSLIELSIIICFFLFNSSENKIILELK